MSNTALAASIANLLSMPNNKQQAAISALSQYQYKVPAAQNGMTSRHNKICKSTPTTEPSATRCQDATGQYQLFDPEGNHGILGGPRRGSVASTRAGGSSADSAEYGDSTWSDAASEVSPLAAAAAGYAGYSPALAESLRKNSEATRSTLKIANIPRRCGKEELLAAIHAVGFGDAYDFFYLPLGPQSKKNHGYAFINFKNNETADRFSSVFMGYPIRAKLLDVAPAPLQGLQQNIEHFSKTSAAKSGWTPNVVLKV